MVKKVNHKITVLSILLFVSAAGIVCFYFSDFVRHLNNWNFGSCDDTLKNIFTFKEYIKHGEGFHLNNLNYPFGEHVLYTDAQPAIAFLCKLLHLENYSTFVLNMLMLLSICICSVLLFHLLLSFQLPVWYSFILSLLISFLSPQISRIVAHYALSYGVYIPLLFYIYLVPPKSIIYRSILALITIVFFSFIHPYYLAIGLLFSLIYLFINYCFSQIDGKKFMLSAGLIIVSIVIFKATMLFTDHVNDRPENPYGHWAYRSTFSGVFIPHIPPFNKVFTSMGYRYYCEYESKAYVGILGIPFLIYMLSIIGRKLRKKSGRSIRFLSNNKAINILLLTSFITWLIACYYPFRLGLESLLNYTGPYKQFRGLGRIGWLFYYGFSITLAYYIYLIYRALHIKYKIFSTLFLSTVILLWVMDINGYLNSIHQNFKSHTVDYFCKENELSNAVSKLNLKNYEAILSLPFFNVGNEHLTYAGDAISQQNAYYMAYTYNKPFISIEGSRTSWSQSRQAIQLLSNEFINKEIIQHIGRNKQLLIISEKGKQDSTLWLIKNSTLLLTSAQLNFYAFELDKLRDTILPSAGYLDYDSLRNIHVGFPLIFEDFDGHPDKHAPLFTYSLKCNNIKNLGQIPMHIADTINMEFSSWTKLDSTTIDNSTMTIVIEGKGIPERQYTVYGDFANFNLYQSGGRRNISFPIYPSDNKICIYVKGNTSIYNYLLKPLSLPIKIQSTNPLKSLYNNFEVVTK